MPTTAELAEKLVKLGDEITELSAAKKKKDAEYDLLDRILIDQMELEKVRGITVEVNGHARAVTVGKRFWIKRPEEFTAEHVYDALIADGLGDLAKRSYDANTVTAYFNRYFEENPEASLPPHLAQVVVAKDYPQISVRKK